MITEEDIKAFMEEAEEYNRPSQSVPEMVDEFATVMKQNPDPVLSADLIEEEYKEWEEYWALGACEYELKELADLVYVIYGYARVRGWDLEEAIRRVHRNNLDRCIQPDGSIKYSPEGKVLKRDNPPKVDLSDLV